MEYKHLEEIKKLLITKETRDLINNLTLNERKTNVENFKKLQEIIGVHSDVYSEFIYALFETEPDILTHFDCIPDDMFSDMDWLEEIEIPKNIKKIGSMAFAFCRNLKRVIFEKGSSLVEIGDTAFLNCSKLIKIAIPRSVHVIGQSAFENCEMLSRVSFENPDNCLRIIEPMAFARCVRLQKIRLPHGLKSIEYWVFFGCKNLQEIVIQESVDSMNGRIFIGCDDIVVETKNPYVIDYCKANNIKYVCIP